LVHGNREYHGFLKAGWSKTESWEVKSKVMGRELRGLEL